MTEPLLRRMTRVDFGALARLHAECFPFDAWQITDFMELLGIPGASGHIAEADESHKIGGFILDLITAEDAEILTLGVAPVLRRQGIGRKLIEDLARRARQKGAQRLILEVAADNNAALGLYESSGFTRLGQRPGYYRRKNSNMDAFILGRSLGGL